jgi:hypothetical protein
MVKTINYELNKSCFWTLSIVWCLRTNKTEEIENYRQKNTIHTSTNKSHNDQLLTTDQLTWARARAHTHTHTHTHTQTLGASETQVAISDPATAHFTAHKNLGNTRIAYKPRHTHTHTHP